MLGQTTSAIKTGAIVDWALDDEWRVITDVALYMQWTNKSEQIANRASDWGRQGKEFGTGSVETLINYSTNS